MKKKYFRGSFQKRFFSEILRSPGFGIFLLLLSSVPAIANPTFTGQGRVSDDAFIPGAYQTAITGTVLDAQGMPPPGANVIEKGTANGTMTDFDGNFNLTVAEDAVLIISYLGFSTQEVAVDGQKNLSIRMEEDATGLEEVVVVGYGTQKQKVI